MEVLQVHTDTPETHTSFLHLFNNHLFFGRASLPVAKWGASCHRHKENQWDLAPSPWLLATGRHNTVSLSLLRRLGLFCNSCICDWCLLALIIILLDPSAPLDTVTPVGRTFKMIQSLLSSMNRLKERSTEGTSWKSRTSSLPGDSKYKVWI